MNNRPVCFFMVGLPGCGKSTWIDDHVRIMKQDHLIISTDRYIEFVASQSNKPYNEVFKDTINEAERLMNTQLNSINRLEANHPTLFWDQTNLTRKSRAKKLARIPSIYKKYAVVFETCCDDLILKRNEERKSSGRAIPDKILREMMARFEHPSSGEGFDIIIRM